MATPMELASEAEKIAQEALKKRKQEEQALLDAYSTNIGGIYDSAKAASEGYLTGAKGDIKSLYDTGYTQLEDLTGEQSRSAMEDLVRQNEGKLAKQGLLGGPSGALNEALAGSAGRVRTSQLDKLTDYINTRNSALANVYSSTGSQLSALEQAYAGQRGGLLNTALVTNLDTTQQGAQLSDKYTQSGLEAALGTNKIQIETAAQKDLAQQQADLNAAAEAARQEAARRDLANRQQQWDYAFQAARQKALWSYPPGSMGGADGQLEAATQAALQQVGPRPTV